MSKYKIGDKFIIEIMGNSTIQSSYEVKYFVKGFGNFLFSEYELDRLKRYDVDAKANADYNSGYEDGLRDAWECARKISMLDDVTIKELFGTSKFNRFNLGYNGVEIKKLLEEYEAKQNEIKVGDIIRSDTMDGIVTFVKGNYMYVMWKDGSTGKWDVAEKLFKKTGRHCDIDSILKQLKGISDEID